MSESPQHIATLLVRSGLISAKDQKRITVTPIEGEISRRPEMASRRFTISFDGIPKYSLKYLPAGWPYTTEDILETISRYSQFTSINVPKLVTHFETDAGRYFVDEFLESATPLGEVIERGTVGTAQALELMRAIYLEVYGCGRKPSREFVESQKRSVLNSMTHLVREGIWGEFILRYVEKTIDENATFLREVYSSGDIIDRNIVLSNGQWYLIDYEYSHRTIFGFKDAFRNILYTRWARNYTLVDLYPPLKNFPQDVASMISVAWEYRFQSEILDDQAREVTQKHLRYVFWNALDPTIISQLDKRLFVVEEQARQKEEEIAGIRAELQKKANDISRLEAELHAAGEKSAQFQEQIARQLTRLAEDEKRINDFLREIDARQARIEELRKESGARSNRIIELTNWSDDLQHQIRVQGDKLKIQQVKLDETGTRLQGTELQLEEQTRLHREQVANFIYIKSTLSYSLGRILTLPLVIVFKLFTWLYRGVDAVLGRFLWPRGSKRAMIMNALEHLPDTIATATYLVRMHGIAGLSKGIRNTWSAGTNLGILRNRSTPLHTPEVPQVRTSQPQRNPAKPLVRKEISVVPETGVSIVIPVFNEADNLSNLLPSLLSQTGFSAIEVIVVDSGSTDNSVALAKEYSVKVMQIPQKNFSHSGSRNLGAEQASQEYLLSMTADALPTSDTWLYKMYQFARSEGLAAVSCMEIPRADVDLFSRVQLWFHYSKFLELGSNDKILTLPASSDPLTLRKHAQLTDVACLIKRDVFQKYKYRYEYGEDLDLGLRLIRDNQKIGLMSSVKVIHSHRRPAYYHLKRAYVDKLVIARILNEDSRNGLAMADVLRDIISTWNVLSPLSARSILEGKASITFSELKSRVYDAIGRRSVAADSPQVGFADHPLIDRQFGQFLTKVASLDKSTEGSRRHADRILEGLQQFLDIAFEYMGKTYTRVDEVIVDDLVDLLFKQFAVSCGAYIAGSDEAGSNGRTSAFRMLIDELADRQILWNDKIVAGKEAGG